MPESIGANVEDLGAGVGLLHNLRRFHRIDRLVPNIEDGQFGPPVSRLEYTELLDEVRGSLQASVAVIEKA